MMQFEIPEGWLVVRQLVKKPHGEKGGIHLVQLLVFNKMIKNQSCSLKHQAQEGVDVQEVM